MKQYFLNPKNKITGAIKEAIFLNKECKYSKALKIINKTKEEFGDCKCFRPKKTVGTMSTRAYVIIQFLRCEKCKAYSFRQDQIFYFIEKIKESLK